MATLYKGKTAKKVLETILANNIGFPYDMPIPDMDFRSSGYYKDGDKWIAFDNTDLCCWVEEFESRKDAVEYATNV